MENPFPSSEPYSGASKPFLHDEEASMEDGFEAKEPGALYTCASCTKEVYLTSSSPMQCPACEHVTGSSSVFYKIRTMATTYDTI